MNSLQQRYPSSLAILTDLYNLTMAYAFWKSNKYQDEAIYHLYFRENPFKGDYAVASGLADVCEMIKQFKFNPEDIYYLASLRGEDGKALFDESFLNYLQRFEFSCDIDAIPEGTLVFPQQPLLRIKGPLIQIQLFESALLNIVNFQTLIATKASRMVEAAYPCPVVEVGLRSAQGFDGALSASRAAYIGGCSASSNVLAGKIFGIPVNGTHAHSWVMAFEDELQAFETYAAVMPNNCFFLVDSYSSIAGVENAIKAGLKLRDKGFELAGIRLDSGDLVALSITARKMLDDSGFNNAKIMVSDRMDEYRISELKGRGAKIDIWAVGTALVTASDQPALGAVFKMSALKPKGKDWQYKMKVSDAVEKISLPGRLQLRRFYNLKGIPVGEMIYDCSDSLSNELCSFDGRTLNMESLNWEDLLLPVYQNGKLVYDLPNIAEIRKKCQKEIQNFKSVYFPQYPQGLEKGLHERKKQLESSLKVPMH